MSLQRKQVLQLYKDILKIAKKWTSLESSKTNQERMYIRNEAKILFRKNKDVINHFDIYFFLMWS
jgi:hypothetical protein